MKRKLMTLSFNNDPMLEGLLLTPTQREVLTVTVGYPSLTSSQVSEITGKTMRRCSAILKALHIKGYLARKPDPGSENGLVYRYSVAGSKWGR